MRGALAMMLPPEETGMDAAERFDLTVVLQDARWRDRLPEIETRCEDWMRQVLLAHAERLPASGGPVEVACILTNDSEIHEMNLRFRGKDAPTNVLSFPANAAEEMGEGQPLVLGDVLISLDTLEREARAQEKSLANHTAHMLMHGMLHLLGFDHLHDEEAAAMEQEEIRLLAPLGIADPYRSRGGDEP